VSRIVVASLASLGASIVLVALLVIVVYNPSKLPLELVGLKDYTILDTDESILHLRSTDLLVATPSCAVDELRTVARDIEEDYRGYDYIDIIFKRRFSESACKGVAVIGSTEEGRRRVQEIEGEPLSGSKNGDEVFFYEL
jgi:hypothetical protein